MTEPLSQEDQRGSTLLTRHQQRITRDCIRPTRASRLSERGSLQVSKTIPNLRWSISITLLAYFQTISRTRTGVRWHVACVFFKEVAILRTHDLYLDMSCSRRVLNLAEDSPITTVSCYLLRYLIRRKAPGTSGSSAKNISEATYTAVYRS